MKKLKFTVIRKFTVGNISFRIIKFENGIYARQFKYLDPEYKSGWITDFISGSFVDFL